MKLGIAVVYLLSADNERLLDIHLDQIQRNTKVPYTIYAAVNRLAPRYRSRLEANPYVKICDCPTTLLRGSFEHSYYLEHLVQRAIEDGMTHVVTLHLDSFPVHQDWVTRLADTLTEDTGFVTLENIHTACLFFGRDFYLSYSPTLIEPLSVRKSPEYARYMESAKPMDHSGTGYGFCAYRNGLSWHYMRPTSSDGRWAMIFDHTIYHFGRLTYLRETSQTTRTLTSSSLYLHAVFTARRYWHAKIPVEWRIALNKTLTDPITRVFRDQLTIDSHNRLFDDPDNYLAELLQSDAARLG